jgi:hypothetical protein
MPCTREHPARAWQLRPFGPEDTAAEGPWFIIDSAQIRRLADIAGDHDDSVKVEYRGAGYGQVFRLDADGESIDDGQEIHAQESRPHADRARSLGRALRRCAACLFNGRRSSSATRMLRLRFAHGRPKPLTSFQEATA